MVPWGIFVESLRVLQPAVVCWRKDVVYLCCGAEHWCCLPGAAAASGPLPTGCLAQPPHLQIPAHTQMRMPAFSVHLHAGWGVGACELRMATRLTSGCVCCVGCPATSLRPVCHSPLDALLSSPEVMQAAPLARVKQQLCPFPGSSCWLLYVLQLSPRDEMVKWPALFDFCPLLICAVC